MSDSITTEDVIEFKRVMDAQPQQYIAQADAIDTDIFNSLITGEIRSLSGFNIMKSSVKDVLPEKQRHDWWNQGRKY